MDALLKLVAVLTLLWGGWMYFKNSDTETELRKVRNELKVSKGEVEEAQASYDAEVKKRDALAEEVNALKEQNQQLEKDIRAKIKEKSERAAQERRDRLAAAEEAREERRKAREAELAKAKEEREAKWKQEEEEERKRQEEEDAKQEEEDAKYAAERAAERERSASQWQSEECKQKIKSANVKMQRYLSCRAYDPGDVQDYGRIDLLKKKWTLNVQACLKAANDGNRKKLKAASKALRDTANGLNSMSGGKNAGCLSDAAEVIEAAETIIDATKQLKKLNLQGR